MSLNNYFDKIYCVNLDHRTDRWTKCLEIFNKYNLVVERFNAIKPEAGINTLSQGEYGCLLSHLEIIKLAKANNHNNILVLEDDVEFVENLNEVFPSLYTQVPEDWQMLYFGGNHQGPVQMISENVGRISRTFTTSCYVIKNGMYDTVIEILPHCYKQVDVYYAELHRFFNCYVLRPHIAWQRNDFSDIQGGIVNYDFLKH